MRERYDLIVKPQARRALTEVLAPSIAFAAWEFINGPLRDNPRRVGKPLLAPFQGDWSALRGHYRVRYRIDDDKHVITVIDIADRTDIYHPGRV